MRGGIVDRGLAPNSSIKQMRRTLSIFGKIADSRRLNTVGT